MVDTTKTSDPFAAGLTSSLMNFGKLFPNRSKVGADSSTYSSTPYASSGSDDVISDTPAQYAQLIKQKASEAGVSPSILSSLLKTESGFNPMASRISPKESSFGLAQINLNAHPEVTRQQAQDPAFAISFAAKRLGAMVKKYGVYEGIQAYNTPGAIGSQQLKDYANKILSSSNYKSSQKEPEISSKSGPSLVPNSLKNLGVVTTKWGESTRYEKFHPGIDIANKKGTPITAFASGVVTAVTSGHKHGENGYGNQVEVTDAYGNKHRYSHLNQEFVKVGQRVGKGQPIALMGDSGSTYSPSGKSTGTHLDYRIVNAYNKYINPYTYLKNFT